MSGTSRLNLPFLAAGQAQKELFHNEALQVLDLMVGACVEEPPRTAPPTAPANGACYIVGAAPTGAWAGKAQCLAGYTDSGWRFVTAVEGMSALVRSSGAQATFRSGAWELGALRGTSVLISDQQVVGPRQPAIAPPTGGTTIDAQSRTSINQILAALRQHGLIDP